MNYQIEFRPAAFRDLKKFDPFIHKKLLANIESLASDPRPRGVEKVETPASSPTVYRIYIGPGKNYRVIYEIQDGSLIVLIVRVGDRNEVYRRI